MADLSSSLLAHLLPMKLIKTGFTTSEHIYHINLARIRLADDQLGVHKVSSKTAHTIVCPPSPSNITSGENATAKISSFPSPESAWEAFYPEGSINPAGAIPGGFGFYLSGPPSFSKALESASEAVFSYRMMLQREWDWVKGGKLPGVFGGVGDLSYACTGGRKEQRCQCFNLRPMWREKSMGELYAYLPITDENSVQLGSVPPKSVENSDYGFSVGRGSFQLDQAVGKWVSIAFRVKLNTVGACNGELEVWVDGESAIQVDGLSLRDTEAGKIRGMHFQTFFGGHGTDWATPKDQRAWFVDVTGAIIN